MYAQGDRSYPYPHSNVYASSASAHFRSHTPAAHTPYGASYNETTPYFAHSPVSVSTSSTTSSLAAALDIRASEVGREKGAEASRQVGRENVSFNPEEFLDLEALSRSRDSPDDAHEGVNEATVSEDMPQTGYPDMDSVYGMHFTQAQPHPQYQSPQPQYQSQPQSQAQHQSQHQPHTQSRSHMQEFPANSGVFVPLWSSGEGNDMIMGAGGSFAPFTGGNLHDGFGSELPGLFQSGTGTNSGYSFDASSGVNTNMYGAWEDPNTNPNLVPEAFDAGTDSEYAGYGLGGGTWPERPLQLQPFDRQQQQYPLAPIPTIGNIHDSERPQSASGVGVVGRSTEARYRFAGSPPSSQSASVGAVVLPTRSDAMPGGDQGYYEVQHTNLPQQLDVAVSGAAADQLGYGYAQQGMQQQTGLNQLYRDDRPLSSGHALPAPTNINGGSLRQMESRVSSGIEDMSSMSLQPHMRNVPSFATAQSSASHTHYPYSYVAPLASTSASEAVSDAQTFGVPRQQYDQHNAVMPPPPLPSRVIAGHGHLDSAHTELRAPVERRHTVAVAPTLNPLTSASSANMATNAATAPPSPSANSMVQASSGSRVSGRPTRTTAVRANTTGMGDAQWTQAQGFNRLALVETYRLRHKEEPPSDMDILNTSALQRSTTIEQRLLAAGAERGRRREGEAARNGDVRAVAEPVAPEDMSDEEFFSRGPDPNLVPARSGAELEMEAALEAGTRARTANGVSVVSPITTSSPEEMVTSHDSLPSPSDGAAVYHGTPHPYTYLEARAASGSSERPPFPLQKLLPLLRHDGHLAPHVSGRGGTFSEAYDGRSYLPDDAEPDPNHVPPAPPGARIGDHPALADLRPHPLALRGDRWHTLMNPPPAPVPAPNGEMEGVERTGVDRAREESPDGERRRRRRRSEDGVKEDERGDGWGFVEGGSHGPGLGLGSGDKGDTCGTDGRGSARGTRLKLSTDKKSPPKMACLFCRNRKIACGIGKGEDKTCNQCERRNLRCVFPTESRRGMRTRKPRSAHTVDGVDEAIKDSTEVNEVDLEDSAGGSASPSEPSVPGSQVRSRAQKDAKSGGKAKKARTDARLKGKGKERERVSQDNDEDEEDEGEGDKDGDIRMGNGESNSLHYANDPLASLSLEAQRYHSGSQASPSSSSLHFSPPSGSFTPRSPSLTLGVTPPQNFLSAPTSGSPGSAQGRTQSRGLFTTNPLSRRKQSQGRNGNTGFGGK